MKASIIIYIPVSRVGKGLKVNIREFHFPEGVRDFFMPIPSRAWARDGMGLKKSRNPKGKLNFWYLLSITFNPWKRYICNFVSSTKFFFFLLGWINLYKNCNLVHILVKLKKKTILSCWATIGRVGKVPGWQSAGMESAGMAKCRDGKCKLSPGDMGNNLNIRVK